MIETVRLHNGLTVLAYRIAHRILASLYPHGLCAVHYANRTQALHRIADLRDAGITASLYKGRHVFYICIDA